MIQADDLPPDAVQAVSAASAQLRAGTTLCTLEVAERAQCAGAVQAVIVESADLATRFLMIGNPLRAPLTLERLMIQATGSDAEGGQALSASERAQQIAGPLGDETRVVAVIQQAETLDPEAVAALREMEPSFRTGEPRVQVLLAGVPPLLDLLAGREVAPPPPVAIVPSGPVQPIAAEPVPAQPVPASAPAPAASPAPAPILVSVPPPDPVLPAPPPPVVFWPVPPRRTGRWAVWLLLAVLLVGAGAVAAAVFRPDLAAAAGIALPGWITARLPAR